MWDKGNEWTGEYVKGHTDISEIDKGLDLLWRNNIKPQNVVFGIAFYGRSFTLKDPTCYQPNGACNFTTGGNAGSCSNTQGILTYQEISARNNSLDVQTFYDPKTTVKYNVFNGNQWISYDDEQSFFDKKKFLSKRGLSGLMIWAVDQDDEKFDALNGLMGDFSLIQMEGGNLSPEAAAALAGLFGAYTGQDCFVTPRCTDGTSGQQGPDQVCPSEYMSVDTAHSPLQAAGHDLFGQCSQGWYRHICCPKKAMPVNCKWEGSKKDNEMGCHGSCSPNQFKLNSDGFLDAAGKQSCGMGERYLCCDSTGVISDCKWTPCQGPMNPGDKPTCPDGTEYQTFRYDPPDEKGWCSDQYKSPTGKIGSPLKDRFKSALCCPKGDSFSNCHWSNDPASQTAPDGGPVLLNPDAYCLPQKCGKTETKVSQALHPPFNQYTTPDTRGYTCDGMSMPPGYDMHFPFCCAPPSKYNKKWPVDPEKLWEHYYNDKSANVVWDYSDEYSNNNKDEKQSDPGVEDGTDAYGFVMLDGPAGSLDRSFQSAWTVVRRTAAIPKVKRSILTSNQTLLDSVFDHFSETLYVYCNYPAGSEECQKIWIDGAEDTIIQLPHHVGEGPFARVVSMVPAESEYRLPGHHLEHRSLKKLSNPIYKVDIDYNFHLIKLKRADQPVNIRVDYTNLLGYWNEMTNSPHARRRKRSEDEGLSMKEWMGRIHRGIKHDKTIRKRSAPVHIKQPVSLTPVDDNGKRLEKRWWGTFVTWLQKLVSSRTPPVSATYCSISDSAVLRRQ
jgi:glycosyl hydrolase family 18 (putative chitinase)